MRCEWERTISHNQSLTHSFHLKFIWKHHCPPLPPATLSRFTPFQMLWWRELLSYIDTCDKRIALKSNVTGRIFSPSLDGCNLKDVCDFEVIRMFFQFCSHLLSHFTRTKNHFSYGLHSIIQRGHTMDYSDLFTARFK